MKKKTVILTILFITAAFTFAGGVSANTWHSSHDRNGHANRSSVNRTYGWNIPADRARGNSQCHRFTLKVSGGQGFARLHSMPDSKHNTLQSGRGTTKGYVCFPGHGKLILGKDNPNVRVKLGIADYGTWIFDPGDRGNLHNGWYRASWDI
ncbi:hypothetical protein JWG39_11030 [Desulforhopalus vacuolatus]|uniref:hypothetical protein n=1 Tax=Desulforhopalus vacuolatus TaxID=40414 RepID=UPI00196502E7|nr:hypothetical protein [Desulforhopalus vacuolatus]MBM9520344.1 hypothetical protein [Desulforhopalus vacuolatus]